MGVPRHRCLHRLQLRSRSPGAYLCALEYYPYVGGGEFSEIRKREHGESAACLFLLQSVGDGRLERHRLSFSQGRFPRCLLQPGASGS